MRTKLGFSVLLELVIGPGWLAAALCTWIAKGVPQPEVVVASQAAACKATGMAAQQ